MSLCKWLDSSYNNEIVKYRFLNFLFGITDTDGKNYYIKSIKNLYLKYTKSLIISFQHIVVKDPILAIWLTEQPEKIIEIFFKTVKELIEDIFSQFFDKNFNFFIRISDLPLYNFFSVPIEIFNNSLIKIKGIVISITNSCSHISFHKLVCLKCLQLQKQIFSNLDKKKEIITSCYNCKTNGPFQISRYHSIYSNFQKIKLQEAYFNDISYKQIILKDELVGKVKPGDEIEITGVIKYNFEFNKKNIYNFPIFSFFVDANYVEKQDNGFKNFFFDFWEKKFISKLFIKKRFLDFLLNSFAKSFIIDPRIRLAIIMSIFGGKLNKKNSFMKDKENLNLLILGNYNLAKLQILKDINRFLPKSFYIPGKRIALKNLTASLKFDKFIQDWTVEGGILVISDKGYCIIDQIHKMGILEQKFLREAISQKKIFVMRKGVIQSFSTRFSIIASANWETNDSELFFINSQFLENNTFRNDFIFFFDLICIVDDITESLRDKIQISSFLNISSASFSERDLSNARIAVIAFL